MQEEYVKVGNISEVVPGAMKLFKIKGKDILVVNYKGDYFAVDAKCPHMGGDLSKGVLDGNVIICPRHHSRFDITNGKAISGPKILLLSLKVKDINSYSVRIENEEIKVKV